MKYSEIKAEEKSLEDKISQLKASLEDVQGELDEFREGLQGAEIVMPKSSRTPKPTIKATADVAPAKRGRKAKAPDGQDRPKTRWSKADKPVTVTSESRRNAVSGREAVSKGARPPLKKAMVQVMGAGVMNASEIVECLNTKGWLPSSTDPRQYVSYMLSSNTPDTFERTETRGYYRVRPSFLASSGKNDGEAKEKATRKPGPKAKAKSNPKVDEELGEIYGMALPGDNVEEDPFEASA